MSKYAPVTGVTPLGGTDGPLSDLRPLTRDEIRELEFDLPSSFGWTTRDAESEAREAASQTGGIDIEELFDAYGRQLGFGVQERDLLLRPVSEEDMDDDPSEMSPWEAEEAWAQAEQNLEWKREHLVDALIEARDAALKAQVVTPVLTAQPVHRRRVLARRSGSRRVRRTSRARSPGRKSGDDDPDPPRTRCRRSPLSPAVSGPRWAR